MKKITYLLALSALLVVGSFSFITLTSAQTFPAGCSSSSGYSSTTGLPCSSLPESFNVDLTLGSVGSDVVRLQTFLEVKGFLVMPVGEAKGYFGNLTKIALASYQTSKGISPADGFFGTVTRAVVNADQGTITSLVSVQLVSTSAIAETGKESSDIGKYVIKYKVTANNNDIYIPISTQKGSSSALMVGAGYFIENPSNGLVYTGNSSSALTFIGGEEAGNYIKIKEGTSATLSLNISYTPALTGTYRVQLASVGYNTSQVTPNNYLSLWSDNSFQTSLIYLNQGTVATPSIKVLSPNGGEFVDAEGELNIKWSTTGVSEDAFFVADLVDENGIDRALFGAVRNTGSYTVKLNSNTIPPGKYKVRIVKWISVGVLDHGVQDLSDNYFNITPQTDIPTSDAEVKITSHPMLKLTYDSKKKESALTGTFKVNVKAGKEDVHFIKDSFWATTKDTKSSRTADNINETKNNATYPGLKSYMDQYGHTIYILPAGKTVAMTFTKTLNPQYMYAGAYNETLKEIYILDPKEPGNNLTLQVPSNTSNTVTIVGENAVAQSIPSITVFNPNGGATYKAGVVLNVQWKSLNIPVTTTINIDLVDSSGTPTRLVGGVKNSGIKAVIIPTNISTGSYRILVSTNDAGASASDYSNEYFTINAVASTTTITTTITPATVTPTISPTVTETTTTTIVNPPVVASSSPSISLGSIAIVNISTTKVFKSGNSINLQWKTVSGTAPTTVSIDLVDSSGNVFPLKASIKNTNYTTVTIPADVSGGAYRMRVYADTAEGYSNAIKIENLTTTGASAAGATPSLWGKIKGLWYK